MTIQDLNREGCRVWTLREAAKNAMRGKSNAVDIDIQSIATWAEDSAQETTIDFPDGNVRIFASLKTYLDRHFRTESAPVTVAIAWNPLAEERQAIGLSGDETAIVDWARDVWSTAADDLADAAHKLAGELGISVETLCARLDPHARDAFREPAI